MAYRCPWALRTATPPWLAYYKGVYTHPRRRTRLEKRVTWVAGEHCRHKNSAQQIYILLSRLTLALHLAFLHRHTPLPFCVQLCKAGRDVRFIKFCIEVEVRYRGSLVLTARKCTIGLWVVPLKASAKTSPAPCTHATIIRPWDRHQSQLSSRQYANTLRYSVP